MITNAISRNTMVNLDPNDDVRTGQQQVQQGHEQVEQGGKTIEKAGERIQKDAKDAD